MWVKRGGSRSHNYQSLFDPRAEKNRTYAIFFLQTSKTCHTFHWNLKYFILLLFFNLYFRALNSKLFPPPITICHWFTDYLHWGGIRYQKLTQCLLSYSLIDDVQSSVTDFRRETSTKIDIEQWFLTIIFQILRN